MLSSGLVVLGVSIGAVGAVTGDVSGLLTLETGTLGDQALAFSFGEFR